MVDIGERTNKNDYYLGIAEAVAAKSTCIRRKYGAIIVKNDEIIATGYNGAPRNVDNCCDCGFCLREKLNIPAGEKYELCRSVHAEMNAIISTARKDMIGSTLYLIGIDYRTGEYSVHNRPCTICQRLIINAGIKMIVSRNFDGEITFIYTEDFIKDMDNDLREAMNKLKEV